MTKKTTRRVVLWLLALAFLAGGFLVLTTAPDAMAVQSCWNYCPTHQCNGPCYCSALGTMAHCGVCPDICIN